MPKKKHCSSTESTKNDEIHTCVHPVCWLKTKVTALLMDLFIVYTFRAWNAEPKFVRRGSVSWHLLALTPF